MRQPPYTVVQEQTDHERGHPGSICQRCPIEAWRRADGRAERIRERVVVLFVLVVLLGMWTLAGLIH